MIGLSGSNFQFVAVRVFKEKGVVAGTEAAPSILKLLREVAG
jgi:hypothetical protein